MGDSNRQISTALQGKLLHVLEDGQFSRVGGRSNIKVDVRVVAATNQDLERAVAAEQFREDLFYRLNVVRVTVPPIRERQEEIPLLASYFVERYSGLFQRAGLTLPPETIERLTWHEFPGNVRELENTIKRMIVLGDLRLGAPPRQTANAEYKAASASKPAPGSLRDISRKAALAAERNAILKALDETRWNRVRAAKRLDISYRSLLYKIKDADLDGTRRNSLHP